MLSVNQTIHTTQQPHSPHLINEIVHHLAVCNSVEYCGVPVVVHANDALPELVVIDVVLLFVLRVLVRGLDIEMIDEVTPPET